MREELRLRGALTPRFYLIVTGSRCARRNPKCDARSRESCHRACSGDLHFDLVGLGVLALWHMHREDAIFELCVYLVEISVVGQCTAAHEGAVAAFDSVLLLFLLFLLNLAFASDGQ